MSHSNIYFVTPWTATREDEAPAEPWLAARREHIATLPPCLPMPTEDIPEGDLRRASDRSITPSCRRRTRRFSPIIAEWDTYRRRSGASFLAEKGAARTAYVLIKGTEVLGFWGTRDEAWREGFKRFMRQSFLVHQIQVRLQQMKVF